MALYTDISSPVKISWGARRRIYACLEAGEVNSGT